MPGLTCLVLAALVNGRSRLAWVCFALAVSVRQDQDGGIHLAMAMSPLVLLRWRGLAMPPSLRRLLVMSGVALVVSAIGMLSSSWRGSTSSRGEKVAFAAADHGVKTLTLHFDADGGETSLSFRFTATTSLIITSSRLRQISGPN